MRSRQLFALRAKFASGRLTHATGYQPVLPGKSSDALRCALLQDKLGQLEICGISDLKV